jgi:uncharacterized protein
MALFRSFVAWSLLALAMTVAAPATADIAVPQLTGRVVDLTGTLSKGRIETLSSRLKEVEDRKGSQIAVLMLPTVKPEAIEQYSMRVAEAWKIGRRKVDDGVLVVIAKDDHRMRIEVGRGLEGAIPDITAHRVIDEFFTPEFKKGDYAGGIDTGVDRLIGLVNGEPLPAPVKKFGATGATGTATSASSDLGIVLILFIGASVIIGALLNSMLGHLPGSISTAGGIGILTGLVAGAPMGVVAAIAAFLIALMSTFILQAIMESGSGGGYSSGGSWSSSGGSSNSGFSGGGGEFGGGGASGDW